MGHRRFLLLHCLAWVTAAVAVLAPAAAAREAWRAPVAGPVTRAFDLGPNPFAPGSHRGADFEAASGTTVRAACSGRVVVAGQVGTSGRLVTLACGPWRATHMPLATIAVHRGARVHRGAKLGTVAPSSAHAGLHLGARRANDRFGYVDPLTLIGTDRPPPVPIVTPRVVRRTPHTRPVRGHADPPPAPAPLPAAGAARGVSPPLAPWPAWAGLAVLLGGAVGTGVRVRVRLRARAGAAAVPATREIR